MTIGTSIAHNDARLTGTLGFLDTGTAHARLRIYTASRPASVEDAASGTMLAEFTLTKPAGALTAHQLVVTQQQDAQAVATGTAVWARMVNGSGATANDFDVSDVNGAGEVKLSTISILAGGFVTLVSAVYG